MGNGTHENRFLIEIDGVTAVRAAECSGLDFEHTPAKLYESNRPNPNLVRGNYEIKEISFKQGEALNDTGTEFFQWLYDFSNGLDMSRKNCRVIVMDESGLSPEVTYNLSACVPTKQGPESLNAGGTNAHLFHFGLMAEDCVRQ